MGKSRGVRFIFFDRLSRGRRKYRILLKTGGQMIAFHGGTHTVEGNESGVPSGTS